MDTFRVRLNCVDHYQAVPTTIDPEVPTAHEKEEHKSTDRPKLPVIRVFGATETGQKVCAHIHGALPYLYIKYSGSLSADDVEPYIHQLRLSIDLALAISYRRKTDNGTTKFVAHVSLVKGVPFYGYHVGYEFFLKIYMLNPLNMTRLADLLRQGAIMKRAIQPYESHMQYLAQWMCDYNLYGCAYIDCRRVHFRSPVPSYLEMNGTAHKWHDEAIKPTLILDDGLFLRQSHCSIEVDVHVADIMNRGDVKQRPIHHDFIERFEPLANDKKLVQSMAGLWRDETRRRKARIGIVDPGSSPFPAEVLVSVSADPRNSQAGGWIHEDDYWENARGIVAKEKAKGDGSKLGFRGFVKRVPFETHVRTALESVEDLFFENLKRSRDLAQATQRRRKTGMEKDFYDVPQVDESRLSSYTGNNNPNGSDGDTSADHVATGAESLQSKDDIRVADVHHGAPRTIDPAAVGSSTKNASCSDTSTKAAASSAELEGLGVYRAGRNPYQSDTFDIDQDFTSDVSGGQVEDMAVNGEPLPKKQKINVEEHDNCFNASNTHSKHPVSGFVETTGPRPIANVRAKNLSNSSLSAGSFQNDLIARCNQRENSQAPGLSANGKLAFPIIKNLHGASTVRKCSQRVNSSSKSSKQSPAQSTFDLQADAPAPVSNQLRDESTAVSAAQPNKAPQVLQLCKQMHQSLPIKKSERVLCFHRLPMTASELQVDMMTSNTATILYSDAYYGRERDVPERPREYAGKEFKLVGDTTAYLPHFDPTGSSLATHGLRLPLTVDNSLEGTIQKRIRNGCNLRVWEFKEPAPSRGEVQRWLNDNQEGLSEASLKANVGDKHMSQFGNPTQKNKHGFKYLQNHATSVQHETQYMSTMSLEVHVNTRSNLVPNPEQDEICCVFWSLQTNDESLITDGENTPTGVIIFSHKDDIARQVAQQTPIEVEDESCEIDLITRTVDIVRRFDPDILTGFEVHGSSWGYLIERARRKYDYNLCDEFSRVLSDGHGRFGKDEDRWGFNHTSTIRVTGRHMINIWRAMRGELNLLQYTMENIVFELCHRRIPHYSFAELTSWYTSGKPRDMAKVLEYFVSRVQLDLEILEQNELVPRTSEQARLLGVDFFSVFSRGSQFKVESLMFRIAKPENLLLPSPSRQQVGQQNALECLPLVMEPQSAFFNSPLLVLDFQSLYPSVMIAYNYCYSTCLGRVVDWRGQNKMGFTDYHRQPRLLELLGDQINVAPNGILYVKPRIRKSLLAKMLSEILETRVMVKSGMKVDKDDRTLQRLLNNRQLALKLIANVTYGYTSASFSGRMPCSEVADSIVQTGRETLEKAIALIHSVGRWGAEVVYGDTDSLFVYLKGRTKDEAFDVGQEIAKAVTNMNPRPIKLKFEKVYHPCILLAKKRYVGFKYESKDQKQPDFDAKGIETVRRDGTPAEQKIEEKALKILFRTADLSQVKQYFQSQCEKVMRGKVSIQDFCFAKEVKLGTYSDKGPPPPGALISTRRMLEDPRAEPQYGERVPFVVITGAPGARLIDRCVTPEVVLHDDSHELDAEYYISKNLIPPLERIFNLVGANVRQWYDEMPKYQRIRRVDVTPLVRGGEQGMLKKTLESYLRSSSCLVCGTRLEQEVGICSSCFEGGEGSLFVVQARLNKIETKASNFEKICRSCAGLAWGEDVKCDSRDCPVFYSRTKQISRLRNSKALTLSVTEGLRGSKANALNCNEFPGVLSQASVATMMGSPLDLLFAYLLGGVTFLPACLVVILLHAYLTFPTHENVDALSASALNELQLPDDDARNLLSSQNTENLAAKFQGTHEPDVAAGYFAVCREYVPGGVNGKPPERTTPAGAVVATESPSVYQSMYRSIFDRRQPPTLDSGRLNGKAVKRARNVFFVVLRHGHLMLYEDSEQLEVKHVISLEYHNVSVYGGDAEIAEGELWIKRNAIRLLRKVSIGEDASKPFFFFSENCSEKEDFYFALLKNQEVKSNARDNPPRPLQYDPRHIIGLVQKLHSSEEQLETRWVNALVGRLYLALYKTAVVEEFIYKKITKKIARAKKPAYLSNIILQKIEMGDSAPQITHPRLKDLTIHGDCCVEGDLNYNGNFRLEIAATARLDLGARFKAREVNLVLAVVIKRFSGHALLKFKPPPSNRIWISFERMPDMELAIEPIVSSRQITYGLIHRAIESRIREVVAETLVLPHWDDSPFMDSTLQAFRGGIWADQTSNSDLQRDSTTIPDESPDYEAGIDNDGSEVPPLQHLNDERVMSMPVVSNRPGHTQASREITSSHDLPPDFAEVSTPDLPKGDRPPKALRSNSFASAADPLLSNAIADSVRHRKGNNKKWKEDAASAMVAISNRSRPTSPGEASGHASPIMQPSLEGKVDINDVPTVEECLSYDGVLSPERVVKTPGSSTPRSSGSTSNGSEVEPGASKPEVKQATVTMNTSANRNQPVAALGAATAAAKKWGWGVLARGGDQKNGDQRLHIPQAGTPSNPIGRGQPLPPPGQPLPSPSSQRSKTLPPARPKRKPLSSIQPAPNNEFRSRADSKPPLPARRKQAPLPAEEAQAEGLLIVQAPSSEPASPVEEHERAESSSEVGGGKSAQGRNDKDGVRKRSTMAAGQPASAIDASKDFAFSKGADVFNMFARHNRPTEPNESRNVEQ
ncbi:uncharacterized protein KY384_001085 [Bacidia gigantensis]|uniref:uncharacterized protein n=1 Tax=Bacidia gigantensis TaxID=2732470 RepID=UPI001D04A057|nr:uncharacterized protein KY384_001085 [Bacidia gigantensis]KAG8534241.1 hypothetical protein KY384_001085 [Bacidia gigantensis]